MARTHYAKNGDIHIAYQVHGDGPLDVVLSGGAVTHLDLLWEDPSYRRFCEQIASVARLIRFDRRAMGLSDRVRAGTLAERADAVRAALAAVRSTQGPLVGCS